MSVDRQLPLEPTERIDPTTQIDRMPGTDAVCICGEANCGLGTDTVECYWPFCGWKDHQTEEQSAPRHP